MVFNSITTLKSILQETFFFHAILLFLFSSISNPQIVEPKFENISVKEGLPENSVLSIIQDHLGFMWFGTQNGLVRYDGYKMKVYSYAPKDSFSISEGRVTALYEDKSGTLWVGTIGGLDCFDRVTEKFNHFKIPYDSLMNSSNTIMSIFEDKEQNLWIGTTSGLYLLNRKTDAYKSIYFRDRVYPPEIYQLVSSLINKKRGVQKILNVGNSENIKKSFNLKKKTPVLIVIMGEDGNDYGYVEDSNGKIIHTYSYDKSNYAGGFKENRIQIIIDTLKGGNYTLHYKSNYSYSFQDGFTKVSDYYLAHLGKGPLHPEYWGIQILDISNSVDEIQKLIEKQQTILNSAGVVAIIQDSKTDKLYIGTYCQGLWELDEKGETIIRSNTKFENVAPHDVGSFRSFCKSQNGSIWIASSNGVINFNPSQNNLKFYTSSPTDEDLSRKQFSTILEDSHGTIWIGSTANGMFYLNSESEKLSRIDTAAYPSKLRFYNVLSSYVDKSGVLWIGTWTTGLEKWDRKKEKLKQYDINRLAKKLNVDINVLSIWKDDGGIIWLGTDKGLISYDRNLSTYLLYSYKPDDPHSISNDDIYYIVGDRHNPEIIWIATHAGLNKFNCITKEAQRYKIIDNRFPESSVNKIRFVHEDINDVFWICSQNGLYTFDKKSGTFYRVELERLRKDSGGKNVNYIPIMHMYEDRQNILWVNIVGSGLIYIDPSTKKWENLWSFPKGDYYIAATAYCEDTKNNLWIGDYTTGIHHFDLRNKTSINYSEKAGLKNKTILSMVIDTRDNLWILSELELTMFNPLTNIHNTFSNKDGLVEIKFTYWDALYRHSGGEIFIGGTNGFNAFYPDSIKDDPTPPYVVIDKMSLFNRPEERIDYEGFISELKQINLPYNQNDLQFEYVGLHYSEPLDNKYRYMLEGFDKKWVDAGTQRVATYTNLDPGEYIFRVIASNRDGVWNEQGAFLQIIINPPFWATTWAYLLYALIFIGLLYFIWKLQLRRIRVKHEFEMSKFEGQKLHEVDVLKSRFFTNISHEFRTPLTLILGPVKHIIDRIKDEKIKDELNMVHRNANKLLELVNQLLDISKLESGNMKLRTIPQNIISLLKPLVLSFTSYAERKRITLNFNSSEDEIIAYLDKDKVEKIITNILSNAFKFTPEGGRVEVAIKCQAELVSASLLHSKIPKQVRNDRYQFVEIKIIDTGIGIPKEKLPKIFDRFYQVDGSHTREQEGTGIGLSLTKELVELHKGKIEVESEESKGTTFTISIPLGKEHLSPEEIFEAKKGEEDISSVPKETIYLEEIKTDLSADLSRQWLAEADKAGKLDLDLITEIEKPLLLIVEDNSDVRSYIKNNLKKDFKILEAVDGEDGWDKSIESRYAGPDLIISDVMMPKMDGFKLCEKLKTDERTSHIPVILLTAKAASSDKIEGYELGADEYIMKPFDTNELKARIKNLIEQRKRIHEHFKKKGIFELDKSKVTSVDKKFLQKAFEAVTQNISNASFSVEALAEKLAVSKSLLHKKIVSLAGEPPVELIKRIRLLKAAELIEKKFGNLSEIALEVGFNNPAYFSECFKKQFGISPSQYQHKNTTAKHP